MVGNIDIRTNLNVLHEASRQSGAEHAAQVSRQKKEADDVREESVKRPDEVVEVNESDEARFHEVDYPPEELERERTHIDYRA